ncbi:hypothetical protein P167DRAFT_550361 [Morchella conica CCBAS932]|uniref:Uncharacterized protein n=1 Tax=Morchella conica CCBAS932 TaxID=1392247 RepID=A0A3N4K811_9PEZI|nr:hypothetical protein P167DRAFT_550361 [Morchella conica CCBAS932]
MALQLLHSYVPRRCLGIPHYLYFFAGVRELERKEKPDDPSANCNGTRVVSPPHGSLFDKLTYQIYITGEDVKYLHKSKSKSYFPAFPWLTEPLCCEDLHWEEVYFRDQL